MSSPRNPKSAVILVLVFLAGASPALAQGVQVPALPTQDAAPQAVRTPTLELDLMAAYEMALKRNLDVQVARYQLAAADAGILASSGVFDPVLGAGVSGDYTKSPAATQLAGADITESRTTMFGLNLGALLPTGTQLSAETGFRRSETNSEFFFLNPRWEGDTTFRLTQPLLDGFGTLVNRAGMIIARNTRGQGAAGFETTVITTLNEVEQAYWNLVAARRAVEVTQRSLDLAQRLLGETRERVQVGTSAAIDLVQSEAGVATRQQELIYARNAAANAEDALKAVLGFDEPAEWEVKIVTTSSVQGPRLEADLQSSIETALESRPLLAQKRYELETRGLNVKLARNAVLPQLDLEASYGFSGLGGKLEYEDEETGEVISVPGGFNDALEQITRLDFPHWEIGLNLTMPLGNHAARGTLAQRRFELARAQAEMRAIEQQIVREVRTAVRALSDGAAAIDAAIASRQFAERNLDAEETKFNNGLSTNYQVLEIQEDLAQAQLAEIQAFTDYRKALAGYRAATGTLLEANDIEIADPGQPDAPNDYWKNVEWLQFVDLKGSREQVTKPAEEVAASD